MKRQITISLFLLTIFCVASVFAQKTEKEKLDFSGTWEFEKLENSTGLLIADKNSEKFKVFHQVLIEQKDVEIKISEKIRYEFLNPKTGKSSVTEGESALIYFIDGRGENNTIDQKKVNSITKWKGNVLTINFYNAEKTIIGTVEWKLSKDYKKLISIKKEKNPKNVAPFVLLVNPLLNNKTTFTRKL